jgi:Putative Se/S carrier protein-like
MIQQAVLTFLSTHSAMAAEDIFKQLKLDFELIPTPRQISAECGFALLVRQLDYRMIKEICRKNKIDYENLYTIKICNGEKEYEKSD